MTRRDLVAEAFGADPGLLPLLPELLADFDALGGWPRKVVAALGESADLPRGAAVVDLGCGKGAISIAIARELGHRVTGVDLFGPFVEQASLGARAAGVDYLCSFEQADLREVAGRPAAFDAAVFTAVGPELFGDHAGCIAAIRCCVRPGGWLVIGDGFLTGPASGPRLPGYGYYRPHDETIRQLTAHGDAIAREILVTSEELTKQNRDDLANLRKRVRQLAGTHPEYGELLERFLSAQEAEYDFLNSVTGEAIWLLRRRRLSCRKRTSM